MDGPPGLPVTPVHCLRAVLGDSETDESASCIKAKAEALDGASAQAAGGVARGFVGGFDQHGVHLDVAFGDLKAGWEAVEKFFDDALPIHADDAAMGPRHAHIGDVGGALG